MRSISKNLVGMLDSSMRARITRILGITVCFSAGLVAFASNALAAEPAFVIKAKQAYMIDDETGTVLLARKEHEVFPPASLAKLMTTEVVLAALSNGDITIGTQYPVTEYAWRTGGAPSRTSTMFAALKSSVPVMDLVTGIVVQNANDGCIIIAEGMAGSDAAFARRMTDRARQLGMSASAFANSTGLPDAGNKTNAHDMVILAQHLQKTFPQQYQLFSKPDFEWNRIFQRNKNNLLSLGMGIDGLGLGFAEGHGYAAVVSAQQDGRRIFLAMSGLADEKERLEETRRIVDWGLTAFEKRHLFEKGEAIGTASVYGGSLSGVDLTVSEPVNVLVPVNNPERLSARIVYRWPLNAPIEAGYNAGTLRIFSGENLLREVPLYTTVAVGEGSLSQNAAGALKELLFFWL